VMARNPMRRKEEIQKADGKLGVLIPGMGGAVSTSFLDITRSEFHKIVQISRGERLLLVFRTFCHVVYATTGTTLGEKPQRYDDNPPGLRRFPAA